MCNREALEKAGCSSNILLIALDPTGIRKKESGEIILLVFRHGKDCFDCNDDGGWSCESYDVSCYCIGEVVEYLYWIDVQWIPHIPNAGYN